MDVFYSFRYYAYYNAISQYRWNNQIRRAADDIVFTADRRKIYEVHVDPDSAFCDYFPCSIG